jgi:hypothetical protein
MRAIIAIALISCAGSPDREGAGLSESKSIPCAIDQLLESRCRTCHAASPKFGAPMPLVTAADVRARPVVKRIADGTMPPNAPLSDTERAQLEGWINEGTPSGPGCAVDAGPPPPTLSCKPDIAVRPSVPHAVSAASGDVYVCYGFDPPPGPKRHITAIAPRIGATAVVHHVTLLVSDTSVPSAPASCPIAGSSAWRSVFGWAPGGNSLELPKEAGFAFDENSHYVVQIHYSNPTAKASLTDTSGFDLCTTSELRANDADVMAFGAHAFTIPPHAPYAVTCSVQVPSWGDTTHLFAAFPHMHTLGTSIATTAHAPDGSQLADLGSQPRWDFGNQSWLPIDFTLRPGDTVKTRCAWNNTTDSYVTFGEKTSDEMCYAFVMYYPRITHPSWHWSSPAVSSVCTPL